ncbi:hypothetical protein [Fulvivirga lutimaris]|uniref:hypothetical protein n=1 Tax=Fulvivirga lutimaris TaxID=1819566 RepID=UPI0012BC4128|nr:hypothetical protein [Fulvivirga lutimaris]MTI38463.1 hypothetical protein [Fulvivirga lutimaris]
MNRHKVIAPQFIYYLSLSVYVLGLIAFAFINNQIFLTIDLIGLFLVILFECIWVLLFIFLFLRKTLYLKLDLQNRVALYGNIFIKSEISFDEIGEFEKVWWLSGVTQFKLQGKTYYLGTPSIQINEIEQILSS